MRYGRFMSGHVGWMRGRKRYRGEKIDLLSCCKRMVGSYIYDERNTIDFFVVSFFRSFCSSCSVFFIHPKIKTLPKKKKNSSEQSVHNTRGYIINTTEWAALVVVVVVCGLCDTSLGRHDSFERIA